VKVEYLTELDLRVVPAGWMLLLPFEAKLHRGNEEEWLVVPAGFVTDGASVPRLPFTYALFGGRARKAATLHDYCYSRRRDRAEADAIFLAAMEQEESRFVRGFMYAGVRVGGWTNYLKEKAWPTRDFDSPA
jgi:hypothetical protein